MELMEAKIVAIITLTMGSLLVGLLPAWFSTYGRNRHPLFLSGLLCFGGGVLLSTSIVHMLPEIRENLPKYKEYAEILFACGFFTLYIIDELVHLIFPDAGHGHDHSHGHGRSISEPSTSVAPSRTTSQHRLYDSTVTEARPLLYPQLPYNPSFVRYSDDPASQICHIGHVEPCNSRPVGSLGLLFALSVHAVLEGLAVGLETSATQVLLLFGAIASHKLVVGFCLGVELAAENTVLKHFVSILIFSMGSPLGIGLGMIFSNIPKDIETYLLPILQGLAGGTLFYVSVSEVLPRERARWHNPNAKRYAGFFQFVCVAVGFIIMTALTKYMGK